MERLSVNASALLVVAFTAFGCAQMESMYDSAAGWTTLIEGDKGLENFNRLGDANWRAEGGAIVADNGKVQSYLVTRKAYTNFQIRAEFWADHDTNSGIFVRMSDVNKVTATNSYEFNIYDRAPRPEFATGAVVNFGRIQVPNNYQAGGKWNTYVITVKDTHLQAVLNGVETVTFYDSQFANGPFALQYGLLPKDARGGAIKWRKVQIKEL